MRVTAATARDVDALVALITSSPLLQRYGVSSRGARRSLVDARRSGDLLLITRDRGYIAGLAWIVPTRALDRAAYLRLLLVAEAKQSQGVGAALLEAESAGPADSDAATWSCWSPRRIGERAPFTSGRDTAMWAACLASFVRGSVSRST